jgi:glycosyltransferase involved in cell wall biosynthesis
MAPRSDGSPGDPLRVLFIDHTARWGGGEVALFNLIGQLDRRRVSPAVVLLEDGALRERLEAAGVPVRVLPLAVDVGGVRKDTLGAFSLLRAGAVVEALGCVRRLAAVIREAGVDLVHTNSLKSDVLGGLAGRWAGVPVVWHVRDRISDDYLPRRVAAAFRAACRVLPTAVVANSHATLATLGPGLAGRSFVVHDGTPLRAGPVPLGRNGCGPVIGLVGRLTRWKGQHVFLDAAAAVLRRFPDARFQLIGAAMFGEADYERQLRQQAERLGLNGSVEFCGFRSDVADRIDRLDVLVHASVTGEPFGQVVIEGMMAGRPVVATAGGGVPEIVEDGVTGLLVPMGDAAAMAAAIGRLLADPALSRTMGVAGRARAVDRFTIGRTARGVEAVYERLVAGGRVHRP